jgi:phosphoribosylaminoimidazolecarboxamide formyltransferase / IMP cyclohydrolase
VSANEARGQRRIAVGVSRSGSNLRALVAAAARGELGGDVTLVFADRACPALDWAAEQGIETILIPGGDDEVLADTLAAVEPDALVLAGYLRLVGPRVLAAFAGRILNVHPSLLPAFPGLHAVRDALAAGVAVTGVTVHLVDATLDGGPIVAQEAVPVLQDDTEEALLLRLHAVEHRLLTTAVANLLAGALTANPGARRTRLDASMVDRRAPVPRRALLSVSDKTGLVDLGRGLVARRFELVSTGGTARALREAGLPVTDIAAVTGFPEMLDGRVKTLHPRVHAALLADRRRADHREALAAAGIAPFDLVVVNLYPFAEAARKPGLTFDQLVEEIDIGGPSMVRAAAKNHASVAIVTSPARYAAILEALDTHGEVPLPLRSALAVESYRHTAAYDARIAAELPGRMAAAGIELPADPGLPGSDDPFPPVLTVSLEKVDTLRYGENPHQPAARYRRTDREPGAGDGPFAGGDPPLQGKALSYNNVLDASAAAALARLLRGPGIVIVKHTNPCGAAERPTLLEAWDAALAGDPVSAFGGVVAINGPVDRALAERLTSIFVEVIVAPAFDEGAREVLATKPNLRLVIDRALGDQAAVPAAPDPLGWFRTAGGAVLVTAPDTLDDDPTAWTVVTKRLPTDRERADLDLAWRLCRGVVSNAILLVRDGMLVGLGSGQVSRVDACRGAVEKARQFQAEAGAGGAVAASDAFFPFADGPRVLLDAGVTAIVQPGGSMRDAEVLADVDAAGAAMVVTGTRHFRH